MANVSELVGATRAWEEGATDPERMKSVARDGTKSDLWVKWYTDQLGLKNDGLIAIKWKFYHQVLIDYSRLSRVVL